MVFFQKIRPLIFLLPLLLLYVGSFAQDTSSPDGLLQEARKAAFEKNDYVLAKSWLNKALRISPDYSDIRIFLGRIHTWNKNYDSAHLCFQYVLKQDFRYEDAYIAYADLEYYNDHYDSALALCRKGLTFIPGSAELLSREAKILNAQSNYAEAEKTLQKLLKLNPGNKEATALLKRVEASKPIEKADSVIVVNNPVEIKNEDSLSADGLFLLARKAAFDDKNYDLAKARLFKGILISPTYADLKIFMGRIYTWNKEYDSARFYFNDVLKHYPGNEDASIGLADLEYWNDQYAKALEVTNASVPYHPESEELWLRKAKILNALRRFPEAQSAIEKALKLNRNNSEIRLMADKIKESASKNSIGITYDYEYFDKQFADPWHLLSIDYTRNTRIGSVTGRVNYANRFKENGVQYEVEAYPHISRTFYSYVSAGYSGNVGVFPQWRGGFSLYANLPKSYEGELGFRYLKFSGDPTVIYTLYLGKYYKSWLFSGRTYLTPGTFTKTVSASYSVAARYYYGGADDVLGFNVGYGISPDDRLNSIQLDNTIRLISYKAGISFKKKVSKLTVLSMDGSWINQEYLPQTKGNQYQISIGWLHRF